MLANTLGFWEGIILPKTNNLLLVTNISHCFKTYVMVSIQLATNMSPILSIGLIEMLGWNISP